MIKNLSSPLKIDYSRSYEDLITDQSLSVLQRYTIEILNVNMDSINFSVLNREKYNYLSYTYMDLYDKFIKEIEFTIGTTEFVPNIHEFIALAHRKDNENRYIWRMWNDIDKFGNRIRSEISIQLRCGKYPDTENIIVNHYLDFCIKHKAFLRNTIPSLEKFREKITRHKPLS